MTADRLRGEMGSMFGRGVVVGWWAIYALAVLHRLGTMQQQWWVDGYAEGHAEGYRTGCAAQR